MSNKNTKKPRIKLSPELFDGGMYTVLSDPQSVANAVREWVEEALAGGFSEGESAEIQVVMMTDDEFESIPEI